MAIGDVVLDVYKAACLKEDKQLQDHEFVLWLNKAKIETLASVTNETPSKEFIEKCRLAIIYVMSADFVVSNRGWRGNGQELAVQATGSEDK